MSVKITTMAIAELVEDMEVYPRHAVDASHVTCLMDAIEQGVDLPPVVADVKSKKIVDGWHRVRAKRKVHGTEATIDVELRSYPNEAALVEDAIRMNSSHGRRLDAMDRTRSILMLKRYKVPNDKIVSIMHIPAAKVEKMTVQVATARVITDDTVPGTKTITLKRPMAHFAGKTLTNEQANAHDSMPGTSFLLIANQLRLAMTTALINREDGRLMKGLADLKQVLDEFLEVE